MKYSYILCFVCLGVMWSCTKTTPEPKRVPLLEVEGKFLYKDVVEKVIPATANKIDSAEIADRYIRKWVTDVLMYENGQRNLQNEAEIDEQVEEYRKALVIHQYEQALVEERVSNDILDEELHEFYNSYNSQLASQDNLIKGVLLILPKSAPKIDQVREWVRIPNEKSLENIEKYSLKNAISFDYFMKNWMPLKEILKKAPFKIEDSRAFVNDKSFSETTDSTKIYMLRITDAVLMGQTEPFEVAQDKIKTIMLNKRQSDFIIQFEKDIYNDAVSNGSINFFNKN
ncbi:conserved hypothetical protein [uncultured Paludibacter sp.]|uniref:PpiC domain-containing protein n=1 Tax=uncultured Paludibacter sp. TaxID=497635 RepID=A0A653ABC9_9BACT|nr:conserved hypothetical protein [uncultured Paludibacter sp.]